jgi:hypothetical protein
LEAPQLPHKSWPVRDQQQTGCCGEINGVYAMTRAVKKVEIPLGSVSICDLDKAGSLAARRANMSRRLR